MEPSSLVLVAIVGVWAAYLVPHWLRRREELVQSRTPDRFSARLRVLQRRRRVRRTSVHRSGDSVLTSPRIVVDTDGELLYVPAPMKSRVVSAAATESTETPLSGGAVAVAIENTQDLEGRTPVDDAEPATANTSREAKAAELGAALDRARIAARRRARIMLGLLALTVAVGVTVPALTVPVWAVAPSAVLLLMHMIASRGAAIRSREHLAVLVEQARVVPPARTRPVSRRQPAAAAPARPAAPSRRPAVAEPKVRPAVAAGSETWDPIPVPAPTYTLKPAVFRPEPPPLDLPAAASASPAAAAPSRPGARTTAASRESMKRRAEDIERILALDADPLGLQERKAVNG